MIRTTTAPNHALLAARSRLRALALCLTLLVCPAAVADARQAGAPVNEDARRKIDAALDALGGAHLSQEIIFQGDLSYFDDEATFTPRNRRTIMPFFARGRRAHT